MTFGKTPPNIGGALLGPDVKVQVSENVTRNNGKWAGKVGSVLYVLRRGNWYRGQARCGPTNICQGVYM